MSELNPRIVSEIELRAAYAEDALRSSGVLHDIAQTVIEEPAALSPSDAGDVLLPPKQPGEASEARWQLIEGAKDAVKAGATGNQEQILALATTLDMIRPESISAIDITRIDPEAAIFAVEGGANRTSVVRRQLAIEAVAAVYGPDAGEATIYQFGSDRPIPRERNDKPNAEYTIATEIAGDFLPEDDSLTEIDLNLASARQGGYEVVSEEHDTDAAQRVVRLQKEGAPALILVQPYKVKGGLEDGLESLSKMGDVSGKQFVIATNGQYRPKDEVQAEKWAANEGVDMLPPVALGDEPGYTVRHNGRAITTAQRQPMAYLNEMVILNRQS